MKKIVFDILNNDNGISYAIKAACSFKSKNKDYQIALVADKDIIEKELIKLKNKYKISIDDFIIVDSKNLVHIKNSPREVLKNSSSMLDAFNYLNENNFDGIVSSGDSGAFITLSSFKIKRLPNVSRPAFMPILPTLQNNKYALLLDAGANIETSYEYLNNWAVVASQYYELIFNKQKPSIGLLNVGTEEYKGSANLKEAYKLLKNNKEVNFTGFIEPKDGIAGNVDIILAEGQSGNIFLKTLEHSFLGFGKLLKNIINTNLLTKIGGLLLKRQLKKLKAKFDYRNVGGAYIVGLEKLVVKAHGGSDEIAFENALNQVKFLLEKKDFVKKLTNKLEVLNNEA
ncbi:phosphate acyltransferase PlsX [Metamycoplasma canadense]|uniref:Phosphate acyltransferase n=1 Tax=Metamycoplasma canadense TaxID=29554 RepID=A0A077L6F6_9BACT|nr:phosphate acyltransferase PlsX [Metamycoplasma canadense]BAP39391.1 fatty acid/phospholipid synthesis protein [Metamycoplasma canadense]